MNAPSPKSDAMTVRCPHCYALPGSPCLSSTRRGRLLGGGKRVHPARLRYFRDGKKPFGLWLREELERISGATPR